MLPTIEECKAFLEVVNKGRAAANMKPLEYLDFDGATPACTQNCLAARSLFREAGFNLGAEYTWPRWDCDASHQMAVLEAVGAFIYGADPEQDDLKDGYGTLPHTLRVVIDAFDRKVPGLRERMVQAGVVAP